jgi:hypothetical protein
LARKMIPEKGYLLDVGGYFHGSFAISSRAAPGLEMIRVCDLSDDRTDQRVRRATPLLFTQQFPTAQLDLSDSWRHLADNSLSCIQDFDLRRFSPRLPK